MLRASLETSGGLLACVTLLQILCHNCRSDQDAAHRMVHAQICMATSSAARSNGACSEN